METRAPQLDLGNAAILAVACLAITLWSMSCGGAGSTEVVPAPSAGFSLSSTTLNFADQGIGSTSTPQSVTLTNIGNAALTLSSVQVTGSNVGDFTLTNHCGSSLAASAQCALAVTFAPSAAGTRTASVVFTDNAAGSPQSLNMTGTGTGPGVRLSATPLTFGSQLVGTSSPAQTVTLTNNGNSALGINSLVVTGANPGDFPERSTCGSSVAAGASCSISVTFAPAAAGNRSATLVVTDNSGNVAGSTQNVGLTGSGTASSVSLSATALTFASLAVATTSAAQAVALTNTGNASLSIPSITVTGTNTSDFSQTNTCGNSVAANSSCTISVTFTPAATGARTAAVSISDNAAGSPQTVSLSGTGTAPAVSLSPTSLSFGSQAVATGSTAQTVTLTNSGNATLSITSLVPTGANASDFAETADTCGSSVAAGGNCTIEVTFTPSASGQRTATLSITDNTSGSPQTVSLSGTGSHDVILSWAVSGTSGVVGYNVYRGTTSGGENSTPLNSTPINGTTYLDENVTAGATYFYAVTAVGSNGTQSAASAETEATVPTS